MDHYFTQKVKVGEGADGHAVTGQNAMYMTYIKTIVKQRNCKLCLQSTEINIQYIIINTFVESKIVIKVVFVHTQLFEI